MKKFFVFLKNNPKYILLIFLFTYIIVGTGIFFLNVFVPSFHRKSLASLYENRIILMKQESIDSKDIISVRDSINVFLPREMEELDTGLKYGYIPTEHGPEDAATLVAYHEFMTQLVDGDFYFILHDDNVKEYLERRDQFFYHLFKGNKMADYLDQCYGENKAFRLQADSYRERLTVPEDTYLKLYSEAERAYGVAVGNYIKALKRDLLMVESYKMDRLEKLQNDIIKSYDLMLETYEKGLQCAAEQQGNAS